MAQRKKKAPTKLNKKTRLKKGVVKKAPPNCFSLSSTLKQSAAAITRTNKDGTVSVLDLNNDNVFFSIDGLAAEVWNQLDGKKTLETILSKLSKKEKVELPFLEKECLKFVGQLKNQNLLDESSI